LFEARFYRRNIGENRFKYFTVTFMETDLWIGIDRQSFRKEMIDFALTRTKNIRRQIEEYCKRDTKFLSALSPYEVYEFAPPVVKRMSAFGEAAEVGSMAAVAGVFAQEVGQRIETEFGVKEIVIENGGDIYLNVKEPAIISIYAGSSPLSEKVGLTIGPAYSPLGICTSSGNVGHSFSFGKANAVVIVCKETGLADAYATSFCNKVQQEEDIESVLNETSKVEEILTALVILNERLGVQGVFPLEILRL